MSGGENMYSLLTNKVYLYLLVYYNGWPLPSYVALSRGIKLTRQTVATKVKELRSEGILLDDELGNIQVLNPLNLDVNVIEEYLQSGERFDARELLRKVLNKPVTEVEISYLLGRSKNR